MARFIFTDYYDIGTKGYPNAGTWEASEFSDFSTLIDSTYKDPNSVYEWVTPLEYTDAQGIVRAHADLSTLYVRVKIWIDNDVSDWYYLPVANQNDQTVTYTENGVVVETANSLDINFN